MGGQKVNRLKKTVGSCAAVVLEKVMKEGEWKKKSGRSSYPQIVEQGKGKRIEH